MEIFKPTPSQNNFAEYGENKYCFYKNLEDGFKIIYNFEVRPDDVWVLSFPKAGTTWTMEMVWLICNDLDFNEAKKIPIGSRFKFLELGVVHKMNLKDLIKIDPLQILNNTSTNETRFIKSHLPLELLPKNLISSPCKKIYVTRHPMDTVVSFYHHSKLYDNYQGTVDEFVNEFVQNRVLYSPFDSHVNGLSQYYDQSNFLFLSYERMLQDLPIEILHVANFFGKNLDSSQVNLLSEHLSFKEMKTNPAVNKEDFINKLHKKYNREENGQAFLRKGKSECWKEELSEKSIDLLQKWMKSKNFHPATGW